MGILDFDYIQMKEADGFSAPVFLVGFVFVSMLTAINMFIAILSEYYTIVKTESTQVRCSSLFTHALWSLFTYVLDSSSVAIWHSSRTTSRYLSRKGVQCRPHPCLVTWEICGRTSG